MSDNNTSYFDLYKALKADGAVQGDWNSFHKFVGAPGKQGYLNRKKLYDALKADGAVQSSSYEEFNMKLFRGGQASLKAAKQRQTQQSVQQPSKPMTTAERARQVNQEFMQGKAGKSNQPVDYLHRPQSQRGKAPVAAPKNASPFVQSLYEVDNAKRGADYPVSYSSPRGVQQVYQQNQQVRKQAAKTAADHIANDEYRRQSQPMIDNGTVGVMKPMGEIEQEMSDSASKFVDANLGDYINNAVLGEQNAAGKRAVDAYNNSFAAGGGGGGGMNDLLMRSLAYNEENDPDKMIENLSKNAKGGLEKLFQNPDFVAKVQNEADMLGVPAEAYVESMLPHLKNRLATALEKSEYNKYLPKDAFENMANRFIDSNTIGKLIRGATMTRGQRVMQERASAATAAGENPYYKGGTVENVASDVAGMMADPVFKGAAGFGGKVTGKLIGNSTKIGALMANGNLAQRLGLSSVQAITSGGVTGFTFGATSGAIQNFSTGEDTSLGGTLKAMASSGLSEAGSFATMSLAGVPLGLVGRGVGLKSVKTTPLTKDWFKYGSAKIGLEAAKTYMEGMGMYLGGYVSGKIEGRDQKFSLFDGTMESLPTAIGFRLTHLAEGLKGKRYDKNGEPLKWWNSTMVKFNEFLTSDKAKVSQYMMTEGEKKQIMDSINETNAANPGLFGNVFDAALKSKKELKTTGGILEKPFIGEPTAFGDVEKDMEVVRTVYDKIIADPNVSWDAKAKFSAMVMGVMPSSRPLMDYVMFTKENVIDDGLDRGTRKYINEYSKYGELLSKREYTNADERDKALYAMQAYKEQARLWNAISAVTNIDKNNYEMQNAFYMRGIKNAVSNADIRAFVDGLGTKGSAVEREFTNYAMEKGNVMEIFNHVAEQYGMETADLVKAFNKSAMRRTDREQEACIHLRRVMEDTAFPDGKVHEEQSNLNGKDVASDNNLGTEQPNGEAVKQELGGLRQAEAEMDVLIRDNDVFGQNFESLKKSGLTNPQIYQWMIENGLTQEQLEPFAHYINANARVQGMQEATKQKIEEVVSGVVQDWSYKGELNGQKMDGEQVVYVQDSNGRTLIVGSGDIAFDPTTGRTKEDVGDMIICFDPNTKEMVYLKTDDVTFMQTQKPEDFANEYRQRLQMINSQPYNEAAQEQAIQDAAKAENQNQKESGKDNNVSGIPEKVSEANPIETPTDFSLSHKDRIKSYKATPHEKTKSDGFKEITFSSEVTYTKGAPKGHKEGEVRQLSDGAGFIRINPDDIDYKAYSVAGRLHEDGTALSKDEATAEDVAESKEQIDILLTPQLAEDMGPQYNVSKILITPDGRVFAKFKGISGNIPMKRNPLEKVPQDNTTTAQVDTTTPKDNTTKEDLAPQEQPQQVRKFADGTDVPMTTDSKGRPTPDYGNMKPEQAAEILTEDFGENAEKVVDGQVKKAEQALKDAEKMKVDYSAEPNDILEQEQKKALTVEAAKKQLEQAQNIKKAMTAKKVAETMGKPSEGEKVEGAHEAGSVAAEKFQNAPRLQGNHVSKRLPNGEKISGHYEIVPAESLTPSHDAMNGYKMSEGFPVDAKGRTINDRDYEHDKAAQQTTDQMAQKYSGQAITQVPTVSDEGIVYDGNGRTMAGQKAAKNGTDGEYIEDLMDNAQNYGFTREQIEQSGIEHPRLVMVTDERLPYDTATFSKFNRNEKKAQSNTEQAVAKAKTLTSDEIGAIVADIEGNGSLDAFFNNSKAINDLVKTLVDKGIIGQNEVPGFMDGPERLSAQGKEYVKNLLLGSVFKPETIRMLGVDGKIKNAAINGIRAILDNLKLGDYSLRDEIDNAIQLLYEARRSKMSVDDLLKQSSAFEENARDRFSMMAQAIAQALEGKTSTFRELMNEYNDIAKSYNTSEGTLDFYDKLTPEQVVEEFLGASKAIKNNNIKLYGNETGNSETEGGNDAAGNEKPAKEAGGGAGKAEVEPERNDEWYNNSAAKLKTAKGEERKQILHDMGEYVKDYTKKAGFDEPVIYDTWEDAEKDIPGIKDEVLTGTGEETALGGFSGEGKVYFIMEDEGVDDMNEVKSSFNHESTHVDNYNDPSRKEAIIASIKDFKTVKYTDLENAIEYISKVKEYTDVAEDMLKRGEDPSEMLAEEFLANAVEEIYRSGEDVISEITANETLQKLALDAYKFRENDRRGKERQSGSVLSESGKVQAPHVSRSEEAEGTNGKVVEGESKAGKNGSPENGRENVEGRGVEEDLDAPDPLEKRITITDEETEIPSEHGTITKQKILVDGDKEVMKVDEPDEKGEYTGSYYEYDGKRFGDLKEVAEYIDKPKATIPERKQALLDRIANGTVKKKDEAWGMLAEAEELLAEHYGIPYDEYGGRQRTKSTTIDLILNLYTKGVLDKITDEPIPAATEKQMQYLMKLAKGDHTWEAALQGMIPNKKQASWLIDAMKGLDDEYLLKMHPDEIEERDREIRKGIDLVRKANGANAYDWEGMRLLPTEEKPDPKFNPIEKAAEDYKKDHPMTEEEIMSVEGLDDEAKYTAIDYLNGEDDSEIARICYEQAYKNRPRQTANPSKPESETVEPRQSEPSADPMEGIKNAAEGLEKEKAEKSEKQKTATQKVMDVINASNERAKKKADVKKFKAERDKETADLMRQFLDAAKDRKDDGSGKAFGMFVPVPSKALKWMDRHLTLTDKQKEILPKLLTAIKGSMYARIKEGVFNLEDVIENVRKDFKTFFDSINKDDANKILAEAAYKGRYTDPETGERMKLSEYAERERKNTPEHKAKLEGDSKDAEERKQKEASFINKVKTILSLGGFKNGIVGIRKIAESCGLKDVKDTDLQELAETAIVGKAREIASSAATSPEKKFELIKKLYENQPSLNQRDSERVMKQQYSTPAPYAYLADMYVSGGGKEVKSALEPSAGNGMLTIGLPMDVVHVNDIDAQRLANLRRQGFKNVTSQDATQPFADKDVDVVVTNPPFGSAEPKEYDGYRISSLEGQMAINALESMKDDGRAAIIIGGKTEYAKNGSLNPKDKAFLGYLYSHYNVEDVINVDGSLYAKQGTSYPTRIILINGRRLDENAFPPVKSKARAEAVKDYNELYKRISDDILRGERMDSSVKEGEGSARPELDRPSSADSHEEGLRAGGQRGSEPSDKRGTEQSGKSSVSGADNVLENRPRTEREPDGRLSDGDNSTDRTGTEPSQSEGTEARANEQRISERGGLGGDDSKPSNDRASASDRSGGRPRGQLQRVDESVRGLSTEKVTYAPKSENPFTLKAVMPADQQEAVNKNLEKLGDADQFLVDELGYNDKEDLYSHLAAEQVDSVALALQQAKKGNAFIIGDMTGIGKGRQAASLIRYAKKQGQVPVYFTKTAGLLSDVYRDLVDIGSPELRPFVFGSAKEAAITDSEGKVVFPLPSKNEVKRVLDYIEKNGKLPKEYDYVLTTYSQVSNGVYEFDENGARKERKIAKGKSFGAAALSGQRRRDAIEKLMDNAYLILDESHTAGGNSGQGNYFQHIIQKAKNVTFFSATFAKRPDNMPIYALRTAMNQGGMKSSDLIDAVKRGGATLQEIMSQTLTQCGQMIRRERDMTGVTIDWRAIDEPEKVQEQREQYDSIIGLFNDIINFQKTYVSGYVEEQNEAMAAMQASMGIKRGTEALGIKNVPFASKAFNTVQQVLLSLKAKSAAERAIDYLKQGMKPVIALNNTNESQTGNIALGEEMDAPDLGTSLRKGLEGTLRYTSKNAKDESSSGYIRLEDLGDDAVEAYHALEKKIKETSTGLSLSPIDVIKNELEKAGYKVGELTGRSTEFVYNENGTVTKVKRTDTDKKKLAREFNDGQIDALILNKSAATGISLHASSKYKDQRKRVMIVAQQQLDVNDEVQMRGRIDRTGQVARGAYEYVVSLIPAEQRLLMMFKAKLKSLDANTTSSQKSKFNEMEVADITNKYGDKVVREYMAEHLDLYSRMADPFGWENTYGDDLQSISTAKLVNTSVEGRGNGEAGADASKLLGRMALLKVAEQEKMLNEIGELYANEIQRLNEMGENDLEITELPLKAKTISKEVWKEGAEPGGDNAFADNTYIEKVNMAILKKPMKAEEVKKAQDGLTGGKSWDEYKAEKVKAIQDYCENKAKEEGARLELRARKIAEKARDKYVKDATRGQKESGMTDEQIAKMAIYQHDNIYKQESEKTDEIVKKIMDKAKIFIRALDTFNTEDAYVLPVDMNKPNELSGFGNSYGRLIDIKITDNFSPNASTISFATLDGRRKITFPISGMVGTGDNRADVIAAIDRMTRQASGLGDKHLHVLSMDVANWDRLVSNESRKDGYIVTGNLMQALIDSKNQGVGGQLVKYTTDTGEVKTGILMPDRFKPTDVANEYPISSKAEALEKPSFNGGVEEVVSSDGDVKITNKHDIYTGKIHYELRVPKSKAKGGKFFLDKDLLSMVNGNNFESRGNSMLGVLNPDQLRPALARLSNLGVKVREERKPSEDGTHFREDRGVQYSKTDTKDVKNSRIIPEDVDKSVSSQIEKKFDDEVEKIKSETPSRDLAKLEDATDEFILEASHFYQTRESLKYAIKTYEENAERNNARLRGAGFENGENGSENGNKGGQSSYLQSYYRVGAAAFRRELAYREARIEAIRNRFKMYGGGEITLDTLARYYKESNQGRNAETDVLFDKALGIVKRLGVDFNVNEEGAYAYNPDIEGYSDSINRRIEFFLDPMARTMNKSNDLTHTILHEMIHQATVGSINLVKKGKANGFLTPKQIEGVNEILKIYDEVKDDKERFKENTYGLKDAYELTAQMADPRQRKAMDLSIWDRVVNAAHEFARKGDRSILQRLKDAVKKLFEVSEKDRMDKAINDIIDDFNENIDDISMNEIEKDGFAYKVEDKDELDRLNKEKTFRMYSGMQEVDGKLYSPMAAIIDGKRTDATEIGAWMGADERPDLVKKGKFQLVKTDKKPGAGEGPVPAAYNPYMHTSTSMMNDQFTGAYARGNIKVVEWEIPESEKTSGYRAEGAKNAVGLVPWHSGSVNGLLPKDRQRSVMLSRWRKAVRVVPDSEVAESIANQLKGTGLAIPWNVVTPNQLRELAKIGVPITTEDSGNQTQEVKEKFLKQMAELKKEFPQAKFVNVKMTKDAHKIWGKDGGTHFRGENDSPVKVSDDAPIVVKHVDSIAKKVGAKVNMVSSVDEITDKRAKERIERGEKIYGWYNDKTGEVHLYMPNIHDRYTAEKTIWHEVVGHKGMRELFGEDRFEKFLRDVWYDLDKPEYAALKKLVDEERKYNPLNIYNAIEEGIARLAEDGRGEAGLWNAIKNKVSDFFHEIGYRLAPNTKDVKYLLWLSKNLQKNPNDPYWKIRAEAVKYRLDHEDVPSVISHDGMFRDNDGKIYRGLGELPKAEYQEATDGQIHFRTTPSAGTALDRYHRSLDAHGYMFTESYMDSMLSLKNLMTAIVPGKKIEDIASSENPYILQNVMQGAMSNAAQMFERNVMKPLDKAMAEVLDAFEGKKDDEKIRNFNLYMITKHGLERNRILYVRDALKYMRMDEKQKKVADTIEFDWNNEKARLDEELERGDIDLKEYYEQMDDFIRTYVDDTHKFDAGEHDYSGIHAIQEIADSKDPYDDAEAIMSVMDSEGKMEDIKKGSVKDYWDKVKAATQYAIDCDYKNGLISKELHGHVSGMFNWYVPLRKYDETTAEDTYGYITEKGDPKSYIGSTIMRARGHKYLSETNVLAQIGAMGNRAINNGGKNAIKQAFARFIRNNSNNNLVTETSVWYADDPITHTTVERYPDIPEDATPDEISQIVADFNTEMKDLESKGLATKVYRRGKIGYKFQRAENKSQHIVDVMIAGKKHSFIVNGNPRAAQALNGLLENSAAKGVMKPLGSISRMMAQLCTSYNPEFVMRNVMRDAEFASSNVTAKEGARYGAIWSKYYAQLGLWKGASNISASDLSGTTGLGLFAKYRNGTLDMNDKIQRYFKEFMENGGETGWVQIKNMKEWEKQYKQDVKGERSKIQKGGKAVRDFFFGNLENLNEVAENIARFSTYCASRDFGRSVVRSTYDAKEVSTNFNRHGSGDAIKSFKNGEMTGIKAAERWAYGFTSSYLRHCSMFFNAGIQSTNLLVKNLKNHPVGTSVNMLSIPFALGALGALLNNALIASEDEKDRKGVKDPYGELPDYVRRNNLCIYKGGGEFITIPLAIELRAFYGLGDLAAGLTFSPNVSGQKNPYFDAVGCMSQLVPVMDYLGNSSAGKKPLEETIKAISPSAIAPFIEWEQNSDWKGAPIERRGDWNENVPAWQRAYNGTPEGLKSVNKWVNAQTNDVAKGNEDMLGNGFLDAVTNPSMVNHFFGGIGGGAATFTERALGVAKHGSDTETKDIPFVRSLLYTPSEQTSLQRTKSKWYNYKDEMEVTMANVDRLKSKNVPIDKRLQNIGEYYQFQNSKDAVKVRVIDIAEKQMKQWKKLRDKASDTESIKFANENIDRIMMEAVEQLDKLN